MPSPAELRTGKLFLNPRFFLSWFERGVWLSQSCSSVALSRIERCSTKIHFTFPIVLFKQWEPNSCLRWLFTRIYYDKWYPSRLSLLHFLFNSVTEIIVEIDPFWCENSGTDTYSCRKSSDHGSQWTTGDAKMENGSMRDELCIFFSFFFAYYFYPSPWFRWHA